MVIGDSKLHGLRGISGSKYITNLLVSKLLDNPGSKALVLIILGSEVGPIE